MEVAWHLLRVAIYFVIIALIYFVAIKSKQKGKKFPLLAILTVGILMGIYAIICGKYPYESDRLNFAFRYENDIYLSYTESESFGLYSLENFLHIFSYDARFLFFSVAFLYMAITLIAYRKSKNSSPLSLLILLLSGYPIYGCYMLKQCMAMAFVYLGYTVLIGDKRKWLSIPCLVIAALFHWSAWIVVPVLIMMKLSKNKFMRIILSAGMLITVVFFKQINGYIVSFASKILPRSVMYRIGLYLDNSGSIDLGSTGLATVAKGIPFYYLVLLALEQRKKIKNVIERNDGYLVATSFVALTTVLSGFMYWIFRLGLLFYAPVSEYAAMIYHELEDPFQKKLFKIFIIFIPFILSVRLWCQYYFLYGGM